jgi:hypothetical protein
MDLLDLLDQINNDKGFTRPIVTHWSWNGLDRECFGAMKMLIRTIGHAYTFSTRSVGSHMRGMP